MNRILSAFEGQFTYSCLWLCDLLTLKTLNEPSWNVRIGYSRPDADRLE